MRFTMNLIAMWESKEKNRTPDILAVYLYLIRFLIKADGRVIYQSRNCGKTATISN